MNRRDFLKTGLYAGIGFLFKKPEVIAQRAPVVYSFGGANTDQQFYDAEKWEQFFATRHLHRPAFNPSPYGSTHGLFGSSKGFQFGIDQTISGIVGELTVPGLSTICLNPADTLTINGKTISWE